MTIHSSTKKSAKHVLAAGKEIDSLFPRNDWTSTYPGHDPHESLALDFMVSNKKIGDDIVAYAWANRKRLGIRYIIWYGRIISETNSRQPNVWLRYFDADNPNPSRSHKNHPHIAFYPNHTYTTEKSVVMYAAKDGVKGWGIFKSGNRVTQIRKKGHRLTGTIKSRSDGKYLVTRFNTWYPLDSLTKTKPVK